MVARRRVLATVFAAAAVVVACTTNKTSVPPLAGPSEFALSLQISVNPDTLRQDGASQAQITILARDANAQPQRNVAVRLDILAGGALFDFGQLSARNVVTGNDGRASVLYTAPPAPAAPVDDFTIISILAAPVGTDYAGQTFRSADIRLVPPGIILPPFTPPVPRFTYSPTSPSVFTDVRFDASASTGAIVTYAWDFGDGSTGSGVQATHQYRTSESFNVKLTVTDAIGQTRSVTQGVFVSSFPRPTANFTFSPSNPNPNQDIFFNASTSTAATGRAIVKYAWDFGTGSTASGVTVAKSYDTPGTYTVTLIVTDDIGQTDTSSRSVTVATGNPGGLVADFAFSPTAPTAGQAVFFDASATTSSSGITSYQWNFGDGTSGTGLRTSHTYRTPSTYAVTLNVTDASGQKATVTKTVTVSTASGVTAEFTFSPTAPTIGQQVFFNGLSSSSPAGIVSYQWDFGDGSTGTGGQTNHAFAKADTFTVRLLVTDGNGATAQRTQTVTVTAGALPTPRFTFSPTAPGVNENVFFNASTSTAAPGRTIVSYAWTFGDSGTASGVNVSHAYTTAGTYGVQLTVTDDAGQSATSAATTITVGNPPAPTANFTFSPSSPGRFDQVVFDASSSTTSQGQTIVDVAWNFGDDTPVLHCPGGSSTDCPGPTNRISTHTYTTAQTFIVNLVVTDSAGRKGSINKSITVLLASPTVVATASPSSPNPGTLVSFNSNGTTYFPGSGPASFAWTFGDGTPGCSTAAPAGCGTGTPANPTHIYVAAGTYTAGLSVTDTKGRTGTGTVTVSVVAPPAPTPPTPPVAAFTFSPPNPDVSDGTNTVNFDASTSTTPSGAAITNYRWNFGDGTIISGSGSASAPAPGGTFLAPRHTYAAGGYTVTLTVTDANGQTGSITSTVTVTP